MELNEEEIGNTADEKFYKKAKAVNEKRMQEKKEQNKR